MKMTCSKCDEEILGSACLVADAGDEEEPMEWGDLHTHISTEGLFVMLHPNCFKDFIDEVLRQERGAVILVSAGKVEDIKAALMIP